MAHKTGIIIQARLGSSRLPAKVLTQIGGQPLLELLLHRISGCGLDVVVATSDNPFDDPLAEFLETRMVKFFRGNENDVLDRYFSCASQFNFNTIVRLTGDNPLVNTELIKQGVQLYRNFKDERVYLTTKNYPLGIGLEIFSMSSLKEAHEKSLTTGEREHVTPFIIKNEKTIQKFLTYPINKENYRLTVDTLDDLNLMKLLVEKHGMADADIPSIINFLDNNSSFLKMNSFVKQRKWDEN